MLVSKFTVRFVRMIYDRHEQPKFANLVMPTSRSISYFARILLGSTSRCKVPLKCNWSNAEATSIEARIFCLDFKGPSLMSCSYLCVTRLITMAISFELTVLLPFSSSFSCSPYKLYLWLPSTSRLSSLFWVMLKKLPNPCRTSSDSKYDQRKLRTSSDLVK